MTPRFFFLASCMVLSLLSISVRADDGTATSPQRVLILGDSHLLGAFGDQLQLEFQSTGASVQSIAACGFNALAYLGNQPADCGMYERNGQGSNHSKVFYKNKKVTTDAYFAAHPTLTIIALGANNGRINQTRNRMYAMKLMNKATAVGSKCIWIGPPQRAISRADAQVHERSGVLAQAAADSGCEFVYTDNLPNFARPEGEDHYGAPEARKRARLTWERIKQTNSFRSLFGVIAADPAAVPSNPSGGDRVSTLSELTTSKGTTFKRFLFSAAATNVMGWQAVNANGITNGLLWSTLTKAKANCIVDTKGELGKKGACIPDDDDDYPVQVKDLVVVRSAATEACRLLSGRLPTRADFQNLLRSFEKQKTGDFLSERGLSDLYQLFPGIQNQWAWTSSIGPGYSDCAYYFDGFNGDLASYTARVKPGTIICVQDR